MISQGRIYELTPGRKPSRGPVIYWMSRDQRVYDNWAYLYAQHLALEMKREFRVVFALSPGFIGATLRQYDFMLAGLEELEQQLTLLNVPFLLLQGNPPEVLSLYIRENDISLVVTDFDPLRIKRKWKEELAGVTEIPLIEVDAHNIVPCRVAYPKAAFGANILRPHIRKLLPDYLLPFPVPEAYPLNSGFTGNSTEWLSVRAGLKVDRSIELPAGIVPGSEEAGKKAKNFILRGLERYAADRNDPVKNAGSGLSPYLHFGQLSAQRVALEVINSEAPKEAKEVFLEELIVRRELADNFCFYQPAYDRFDGFHDWAAQTLNRHREDVRAFLYSREEFEAGVTHDHLWNAAQIRMVEKGYMHGYMRMYWAKKILEWSPSPEEALETAVYLNDRYQLDGRDPNGYAGIAWSIGGVHDRAWQERPVYGKIRYMNENGCRRKFDVDEYIRED